MDGATRDLPPPLQGCLYCHSEGTTVLARSRKILGLGSDFPIVKCAHCDSTAYLDYQPDLPDGWRICYHRANRAPRYYYVFIHLRKAGWLSAAQALLASTNGFVQRARVAQTQAGDVSWLRPASPNPSLPLLPPAERVYLTLKGVTLQEGPPPGFLIRATAGTTLDSGKAYVTAQHLYLLGQRRDWSHPLSDIRVATYDETSWTVSLEGNERHYRGVNVSDQFDAQLVATIIDALRGRERRDQINNRPSGWGNL